MPIDGRKRVQSLIAKFDYTITCRGRHDALFVAWRKDGSLIRLSWIHAHLTFCLSLVLSHRMLLVLTMILPSEEGQAALTTGLVWALDWLLILILCRLFCDYVPPLWCGDLLQTQLATCPITLASLTIGLHPMNGSYWNVIEEVRTCWLGHCLCRLLYLVHKIAWSDLVLVDCGRGGHRDNLV